MIDPDAIEVWHKRECLKKSYPDDECDFCAVLAHCQELLKKVEELEKDMKEAVTCCDSCGAALSYCQSCGTRN